MGCSSLNWMTRSQYRSVCFTLKEQNQVKKKKKEKLTTSVTDKTKRALAAVIGHVHTVKFESPKLSFRLFTKRRGNE